MEAHSDFKHQEPSPKVIAFVQRIEDANPGAELEDDNENEGWGHYQFTAGNLTCSTVLCDWESIGNTSTACRLIAAAIKTCKVARAMCELRGVQPTSYLSDMYLNIVIDHIWNAWIAAEGVSSYSLYCTVLKS